MIGFCVLMEWNRVGQTFLSVDPTLLSGRQPRTKCIGIRAEGNISKLMQPPPQSPGGADADALAGCEEVQIESASATEMVSVPFDPSL